MPFAELKGLLTDIGTEELGHLEMIGAIVHQLTRNLTPEEIKRSGFDTYFVDHTTGVYPTAASGYPWSANSIQSTGDTITDLMENMAADGAMMEEQLAFETTEKDFHQFLIKMLHNIFISDGEAGRRHSTVPKNTVNTDFQRRKMLNCA